MKHLNFIRSDLIIFSKLKINLCTYLFPEIKYVLMIVQLCRMHMKDFNTKCNTENGAVNYEIHRFYN